jgi:hypothetical protein
LGKFFIFAGANLKEKKEKKKEKRGRRRNEKKKREIKKKGKQILYSSMSLTKPPWQASRTYHEG